MNVFALSSRDLNHVVHAIQDYLVSRGIGVWFDVLIPPKDEDLRVKLAEWFDLSQLIVILADGRLFDSSYHTIAWEIAGQSPTPKLVLRFDDIELPRTGSNFTIVDCHDIKKAAELVYEFIESKRRLRLFISYSREDRKSLDRLLRIIDSSLSHAWFDKSALKAGDEFPAAIARAIEACDYFFLLWSRNSRLSRWVEKEWNHAFKIGKTIIPIVIDATPLPMVLEDTHAFTSVEDDGMYEFLQVSRQLQDGAKMARWRRLFRWIMG